MSLLLAIAMSIIFAMSISKDIAKIVIHFACSYRALIQVNVTITHVAITHFVDLTQSIRQYFYMYLCIIITHN